MAEVLLYNVEKNYDIDRFNEIAKANNIGIKRANKDDIDQLVGYLIDLPGFEKTENQREFDPNLDFPFILFVGFERNELFDFLDLLRENKLSIQHMANDSNNNVNWTLRELLIENDREGKMMGLIHRINGLVDMANDLKEKHGEDAKLKKLINEMQAYFDDSSLFELEVANEYYRKLEKEVKRVYMENLES